MGIAWGVGWGILGDFGFFFKILHFLLGIFQKIWYSLSVSKLLEQGKYKKPPNAVIVQKHHS